MCYTEIKLWKLCLRDVVRCRSYRISFIFSSRSEIVPWGTVAGWHSVQSMVLSKVKILFQLRFQFFRLKANERKEMEIYANQAQQTINFKLAIIFAFFFIQTQNSPQSVHFKFFLLFFLTIVRTQPTSKSLEKKISCLNLWISFHKSSAAQPS